MTTTMFDNVAVGAIGVGDEEAGYVNGRWPTYSAVVARFPGKPVLSIAVTADVRAAALDIETGDANNAQAAGWYHGWTPGLVSKPILYTSASNVPALIEAMAADGIGRAEYYIWSAHYTGVAHICSPVCHFGNWNADLTQWTDKIGGDESLVQDYVFAPVPAPAPPAPAPLASPVVVSTWTDPQEGTMQLTAVQIAVAGGYGNEENTGIPWTALAGPPILNGSDAEADGYYLAGEAHVQQRNGMVYLDVTRVAEVRPPAAEAPYTGTVTVFVPTHA